MCETPTDFIEEDWILIAEALANWAGPPKKVEDAPSREVRAYQLIESIAHNNDMSMRELRERMVTVEHPLQEQDS